MANFAKLPNNEIDMPFFYNISGTVGKRGHNRYVDVALIQYLLTIQNPYPRNGLAFVYFGHKDRVGHWGNETESRFQHFLRWSNKYHAIVDRLDQFDPVRKISNERTDPRTYNSLLMNLNVNCYIHSPLAFLPANVMKAIPGLIYKG